MARRGRPPGTGESKEPEEWVRGTARAREARERVGEQLQLTLVESDQTGSFALLGQRLRRVQEARQEGDRGVLRAAVMDVAVAAAQVVVAIDVEAEASPRAA